MESVSKHGLFSIFSNTITENGNYIFENYIFEFFLHCHRETV